jgi:hypothetical protein
MKRIPFAVLAAVVLVVVLGALHFAGILGPKNPVQVQVDSDIAAARSAFDTIDVQWASGRATFDPPHMLNPPDVIPPLLKYPPSAEALASMSGH